MRPILIALLLTTICSAQSNVQTLAKAIAKAEGYGQKGTIPSRYRNPGDLKYIRGYRYAGQIGIGKGGHVIFRNEASGWAALEHQIGKIAAGESKHYTTNMTLKEISKKYAGNWRVWSKNVAHNLGVTQDTKLWDILDVPPAVKFEACPEGYPVDWGCAERCQCS